MSLLPATEQKHYNGTLSLTTTNATVVGGAVVAVMVLPLTLGVAATFFFRRFLLWRARWIARTLEEDARHNIITVWNDGSMMVRAE